MIDLEFEMVAADSGHSQFRLKLNFDCGGIDSTVIDSNTMLIANLV